MDVGVATFSSADSWRVVQRADRPRAMVQLAIRIVQRQEQAPEDRARVLEGM